MGHLEMLLVLREDDLDARDLAEECLAVPVLRQPAAELLDTLYEAADDPRDLVRILDIRLEGAESEDGPERPCTMDFEAPDLSAFRQVLPCSAVGWSQIGVHGKTDTVGNNRPTLVFQVFLTQFLEVYWRCFPFSHL